MYTDMFTLFKIRKINDNFPGKKVKLGTYLHILNTGRKLFKYSMLTRVVFDNSKNIDMF